MTEQRTNLKELQKLDLQIQEAKKRILDFDPLFAEVEEPALVLESDLGTTRTRLQELKLEERRVELATEEKRTRLVKLEERLGSVRNLREEAAVSAELEMVKRALQNDEQEALTLMDQLRKTEERASDLEGAYAEASQLVEPKRNDLIAQRDEARKGLEALLEKRERFAGEMQKSELKVYDAIRAGGRTIAVAALTSDGACGHCFGMVPLQLRNEILHGHSLIRCESCGVILAAPAEGEEGGSVVPAAPVAEAEPESEAGEAEEGSDEESADESELEPASDLE